MNKIIGIYCTQELYNKINDVAWAERKSLSALVRELIEQYLEEADIKKMNNM